jgi:hypothetical protein
MPSTVDQIKDYNKRTGEAANAASDGYQAPAQEQGPEDSEFAKMVKSATESGKKEEQRIHKINVHDKGADAGELGKKWNETFS